MDKPDSDIIAERAQAIFCEQRKVFTMGPAPFQTEITVTHTQTGSQWLIKFAATYPPHAIAELIRHVGRSCGDANPDKAAAVLAYMQAMDDISDAMHTVPVGEA